ncbi:hypothetical protein [Roseomonas sp. WA12]
MSVEASKGRIVITPADSSDSRAMAAFERSVARCSRTYAALAK